ncbi:NAD(P)/FAD-dependent oxidoreductase [Cytophagaceae bacterium DM2B3-1]|uniref:Kynurenine 3-monooxygenase n=1 Tax=Xanthocytophaga flava TaxID=3048013 RepID=A0ABT7CKQ3_9BACT|nr:NAD(P)/FAD-dependent oxidoreductase [Xanthocytophaga flavus]MDJ1469763.1 NAD(P)/FAD-dependent oxidoreductase [Xanthocytophaga flavus]MDJ1494275.1 NAD(P)/FAD-dependent oxidoreductase [Xanthocytophaga flavus]
MKNITILGAGLVGSLLASLLARKGHQVQLIEKRPDLRIKNWEDGRSINLAMSERGWQAMRAVGVEEQVKEFAIPMYGRMIHDTKGNLAFQPYGKDNQCIYAISRSLLNQTLMNEAEKHGVQLIFEHKCTSIDLQKNTLEITRITPNKAESEEKSTLQPDLIFGSDGAFSAVRSAMMKRPLFDYSQDYIEHGYKELTIPPTADGNWAIEPNALHIWPRGHFMLIALPNPDKTFTCTLFFPWTGNPSFEQLQTKEQLLHFFEETFPDILPLMPDLVEEFFSNPTSALLTVRCFPWTYKDKVALIGDAAHAIVPFFGQGMNCGFEDCVVLDEIIDQYDNDWNTILSAYEKSRKPNSDAIAELALQNFVEMRDKVADPRFLLRKKIDAHLNQLFPDQWIPLYTMISFTTIPYADALEVGKQHDAILNKIMEIEGIEDKWQTIDYQSWLGTE